MIDTGATDKIDSNTERIFDGAESATRKRIAFVVSEPRIGTLRLKRLGRVVLDDDADIQNIAWREHRWSERHVRDVYDAGRGHRNRCGQLFDTAVVENYAQGVRGRCGGRDGFGSVIRDGLTIE